MVDWEPGDLARVDGEIKEVLRAFDFVFQDFDGEECMAFILMFTDGSRSDGDKAEYVTENELYLEELKACQDGHPTGFAEDAKSSIKGK